MKLTKIPVNAKLTTATYFEIIPHSSHTPSGMGIYFVSAQGDVPNLTVGATISKDPHFVGGLKLDATGYQVAEQPGTSHYIAQGSFEGAYYPQVIVSGSNGDFAIDVTVVSVTKAAEHFKAELEAQAKKKAA